MWERMPNLKDNLLSGELEVELIPQGTLATRAWLPDMVCLPFLHRLV